MTSERNTKRESGTIFEVKKNICRVEVVTMLLTLRVL